MSIAYVCEPLKVHIPRVEMGFLFKGGTPSVLVDRLSLEYVRRFLETDSHHWLERFEGDRHVETKAQQQQHCLRLPFVRRFK